MIKLQDTKVELLTEFILNPCSTKYAPTLGCEQQNTHKKYVRNMT